VWAVAIFPGFPDSCLHLKRELLALVLFVRGLHFRDVRVFSGASHIMYLRIS
jgi:hypothetical protein